MSGSPAVSAASNPFSTRFVRPGAIRFVFDDGNGPDRMVERLARMAWRAQIVGPHGSGKSTLVASLDLPLRESGRSPYVVALHDGEHRMPPDWHQNARAVASRLIVIDGYEQLRTLSRWNVARRCSRDGWGLVVTAHRDVGLPTLARVVPSLGVAQEIVDTLMPDGRGPITPAVVAEAFSSCHGNIREMLFALYDRYETLRRRRDR